MTPVQFRHIALSLFAGLFIARFAFGLQELTLGIATPAMTQVAVALVVAVYASSFLERRANRVLPARNGKP